MLIAARDRRLATVLAALLAVAGLAGPFAASRRENSATHPVAGPVPPETALLFHLSASHGLTADYAAGRGEPNFASDVRVIEDGADGPGIECAHTQLLSYWAPGNIYAQRGTLSFFWRSREPAGKTPFPVFRVGYADHSSWDMVWLRIDYNGKPGFDAFVTDASLARTRVSYSMPAFPAPSEWTHIAFAWDETAGVRLYVNGQIAAAEEAVSVFDAALDQFGPHSRIISPYQVQSAYNFVRGGDIDEVRIYDRMLSDANIAALSRRQEPGPVPALARTMDVPTWRAEWLHRYGWDRVDAAPAPLSASATSIRKVEIHEAYDLKRWWWKGTDGIRETTWPGVYNRSRLPGRNDYFQLPDWDCYSLSGKTVTFVMPDEPWNQVEITGAAFGTAVLETGDSGTSATMPLFERPSGQERTSNRLATAVRGGRLRFTNVAQETPIGELGVYNIAPGREPTGTATLAYRLTATAEPDLPSVRELVEYIAGRHPADERSTMLALPGGAPRTERQPPGGGLPIVHVLVPSDFRDLPTTSGRAFSYGWTNLDGGLDGIALDLPPLDVKPTHGDYFPLNIQVRDPIWPLRTMLDVGVSVKPGEPHTLWLDLRDRVLINGKGLYLVIAGAGSDFGPAALEGAALRLVFKPRREAIAEHVLDRFTQVRDNYAHIVEERPNTRRLNLYTRFETDITDLLRVDPDNRRGLEYWSDYNREVPRPPVRLAEPPPGVPLWAFRQVEHLGHVRRFVNWYIDNRQIENGEFGGGLSDDGDLTNWWPGTALMGATPAKVLESLRREMEAYYDQGMFTNGLSTIQADELHSYEEGIQVLGQSLLLDYGNPKHLERAMETAAAIERLTGINPAGHRHFRSSYFSGTQISEEGVWAWSKPSSYLILHPALALVEFNGAPRVRKWLLELADGVLAHRTREASGTYTVRPTVEFATDRDLPAGGQAERAWPLLWAAWRWTGDEKYLQPFRDAGPGSLAGINADALDQLGLREQWGTEIVSLAGRQPGNAALQHFAWQVSGDTRLLADLYAEQATAALRREFINTEGSLWIDRVSVPHTELQRARLGGVALVRNATYPGHTVSWEFEDPGDCERVAILVPVATPRHVRITAYNLRDSAVRAVMTAWDVEPGTWSVTSGAPGETDGGPKAPARTVQLERTTEMPVLFAPRSATTIELVLKEPGIPYWKRPDLGISEDDVESDGKTMTVTVHGVGALAAPASQLVLRDGAGRTLAAANIPPLGAPIDLVPRTARVQLHLAPGVNLTGASITVEVPGGVPEITRRNNRVILRSRAQSEHAEADR
ncbi:MAG: LamG-like jellyroll fold domain-containing protein [Vicinamibacterales bacterium]